MAGLREEQARQIFSVWNYWIHHVDIYNGHNFTEDVQKHIYYLRWDLVWFNLFRFCDSNLLRT